MRSDERALRAVRSADRGFETSDEAELQATCRRQAAVIEALMRAVGDLRSGATALKADNADLRSERLRHHRREADVSGDPAGGSHVEAQVSLSVNAPAMARRIVADALRDRLPRSIVDRARLTVSELVTNSVRHGVSADGGYAIVRLHLTESSLLIEVEDPGQGGPVVPRSPNARTGGGFGLHVVETLCERWGSERRATGAMRVWAELSVTAKRPAESPLPVEPRDEVHVVPDARAGTWRVYLDANVDSVLSQHDSETAAVEAARAHATRHQCRRIVVHDRYFRTRSLSARGD